MLLAYDQVLRRHVWIHVMPPGAPAVAPARRDLARSGRLRWLTGKRTPVECWDAYDAPEGLPFVTIGPDRRSWSAVRFWLFDVARELEAIVADRGDIQAGYRICLDYREQPRNPSRLLVSWPPLTSIDVGRATITTCDVQSVLVCSSYRHARARRQAIAPAHAHAFLEQLEQRRFPDLKAIAAALQETLGRRAVLTRGRRGVHLVLCALVPACAADSRIRVGDCLWRVHRGRHHRAAGLLAHHHDQPGGLVSGVVSRRAHATRLRHRRGHRCRTGSVTAACPGACDRRVVALSVLSVCDPRRLDLVGTAALVFMAAGAVIAYITPERGLQDRLVRTRLVPR